MVDIGLFYLKPLEDDTDEVPDIILPYRAANKKDYELKLRVTDEEYSWLMDAMLVYGQGGASNCKVHAIVLDDMVESDMVVSFVGLIAIRPIATLKT